MTQHHSGNISSLNLLLFRRNNIVTGRPGKRFEGQNLDVWRNYDTVGRSCIVFSSAVWLVWFQTS